MGLVVDQPCAATPTAMPAPRPPRRPRPANATLSRPAWWNCVRSQHCDQKYTLDNNSFMMTICPTSPSILSSLLPFLVLWGKKCFRGSQQEKASVNQLHGLSTNQLVKAAWLRVMYLAERSKTRFLRDQRSKCPSFFFKSAK